MMRCMCGTGAARLTIFLDDAGTINDPDVRAGQLRQAVGDFLSRQLGGEPGAWAAAHEVVLAGLWDGYRRTMFGNVTADYAAIRRGWLLGWARGMCERCGVAAPAEDACLELALRMEADATRRVRAAYPGVVDAIRVLHASGHTLHTASSEDSAELAGYLEGMGVRPCFGRLYGPDLIGTIKEGPIYYSRIFADAGVVPERALVVDDNPLVIGWLAPDLVLGSLVELPSAVHVLEARGADGRPARRAVERDER